MDRKAENRTRMKFLAVGEACVAIYSDLLQALKREYLSALGSRQRGSNFRIRSKTLQGHEQVQDALGI